MDTDGYFHLPETVFASQFGEGYFERVGTAIVQLMQYGWQPTFINLYDEAWLMVHFFSQVMEAVTGNKPNMDMLSW